jgi:hypothetical protein
VTFEPGSKLSCLERRVFAECPSLSAMVLPSSLHIIPREYRRWARPANRSHCECA